MEEEKEKDLYIPANCSPLDYVIEGFTAKEITYIGAVIAIALILGFYIFTIIGNSIAAVFIGFVLIASAILFFRRDQYSENCIDKIKIILEYHKAPKKFEYNYKNIYEATLTVEDED